MELVRCSTMNKDPVAINLQVHWTYSGKSEPELAAVRDPAGDDATRIR